ncbi:MAG: hypothetical protein ACJ754_23500 [Pyrinomonadaceae bacterium]
MEEEATARGGRSRRHIRPFERAYNNYMQRRQELWLDLQQNTTDACRSFAEAATDMALESQRQQEEAYRDYLEAARKPEELSDARLQAQQAFSGALQEQWGESTLKSFDSYREQVVESRRAWEEYQRGCLEAYHQYLRDVQEAWSQADFKAMEAYSLSAISWSQLSVAYKAARVTGFSW